MTGLSTASLADLIAMKENSHYYACSNTYFCYFIWLLLSITDWENLFSGSKSLNIFRDRNSWTISVYELDRCVVHWLYRLTIVRPFVNDDIIIKAWKQFLLRQ